MPDSTKTLLYYVHHHGAGHLQRARTLIDALETQFAIIFVVANPAMQTKLQHEFGHLPCECLPSKWAASPAFPDRTYDSAFEGVPCTSAATQRALTFVNLLSAYQADLFISDVSAELSILARAAGVPVVMQRHSGETHIDPTQVFAYQSASALYAPYPRHIEDPDFEFIEKTRFLGFFSQLGAERQDAVRRGITLVSSKGEGVETILPTLQQLQLPIWVVGCEGESTSNVTFLGYVNDISVHIPTDVVVCSGGNNLLSELLLLGKKLIIVPQSRPYNEQVSKAAQLTKHNYAVTLPVTHIADVSHWQQAVHNAASIDTSRVSALANPHAAEQFAALIKDLLCPHSR
ncbi:glycosyltransferase [Alteromonas lipotrueiana]|uniref:glycosyltransferase n=1 Tax=Alteromonas lipotrueiana TaxID=2803815 RepID=UPI001C4719BC|nr:glycosyltransferase [Alteromonas lipotrueiana]